MTELVGELTPLLWQVARAQGLDRDHSIDVVQTAWLELLGSLAKIHSPVALTSWLVTVTKREAWRAARAARSELPAEDLLLAQQPDPEPMPDEQIVDRERRQRLWAAVNQLSQRCQQLLRVVAFAQRPDYDAISSALGMRPGSIGPTRGRCLAKLRDLLTTDPDRSWP